MSVAATDCSASIDQKTKQRPLLRRFCPVGNFGQCDSSDWTDSETQLTPACLAAHAYRLRLSPISCMAADDGSVPLRVKVGGREEVLVLQVHPSDTMQDVAQLVRQADSS